MDYNSDLEQIEKVTLAVARELTRQADGAVSGFEPHVRYHAFGASSINFTVWLGARDFASGLTVKHDFIKRLHEADRRAGISMPFPTRTLELTASTFIKLRELTPYQENGTAKFD